MPRIYMYVLLVCRRSFGRWDFGVPVVYDVTVQSNGSLHMQYYACYLACYWKLIEFLSAISSTCIWISFSVLLLSASPRIAPADGFLLSQVWGVIVVATFDSVQCISHRHDRSRTRVSYVRVYVRNFYILEGYDAWTCCTERETWTSNGFSAFLFHEISVTLTYYDFHI